MLDSLGDVQASKIPGRSQQSRTTLPTETSSEQEAASGGSSADVVNTFPDGVSALKANPDKVANTPGKNNKILLKRPDRPGRRPEEYPPSDIYQLVRPSSKAAEP